MRERIASRRSQRFDDTGCDWQIRAANSEIDQRFPARARRGFQAIEFSKNVRRKTAQRLGLRRDRCRNCVTNG